MEVFFSDMNEELPIIEEDDSAFYENIAAPKFVDFCAPDKSLDDTFWFCLRLGCTQQHDEIEVNPDALHRDFMHRVMAARSPNLKFDRSLSKRHQSPRSIKKCPRSAPAKSVKFRMLKSNSITTIPNNLANKHKNHQVSSLRSPPSIKEAKTRTSANENKALTTPRSKRIPTKYEPFRSAKVGNEKAVPSKHKHVARSLFTGSASKYDDICDGMKKLYIDSVKKSKKNMSVKKKIEAASTEGEVCKAISEVQAEHEYVDSTSSVISTDSDQSEDSEESLKVNEVVPQISQLDNSAEFNDDKENDPTIRCTNVSTVSFEINENIPQKGNKAPKKKLRELAAHKENAKRTTNPKPFRLRTDERGIVREANLERKTQVKSQKENLPTLRHGDVKNKNAINQKNIRIIREGPKCKPSKEGPKERVLIKEAKERPKEKIMIKKSKERAMINEAKEGPKERVMIKESKGGSKERAMINEAKEGPKERVMIKESKGGSKERAMIKEAKEGPKEKVMIKESKGGPKERAMTAKEGPKERAMIKEGKEGPKERVIIKEAKTKRNTQPKPLKEVLATTRHTEDVKNQKAIREKSHKTTLEGQKPNETKATRIRHVESRYAKSMTKNHKLQSENKETEVSQNKIIQTGLSSQNKIIKTGLSNQNTQRASNLRKTMISQAKVTEGNASIANAVCLKGKRPLAAKRETKPANPSSHKELCKVDNSEQYYRKLSH